MKRILLLAALLAGIALFLWLVITASRPLLAWQWWMIPSSNPQGAPAACEAAGLLNQRGASRPIAFLESNRYTAEAATADIQTALAQTFPGVQPVGFSDLVRVNVTYNGTPYQWLQTVQLTRSALADEPGVNLPGMTAIALVGEDVEPQAIAIAGAGIPELTCPFKWRDWAVDTVRGLPFLSFAGYVVLGIGVALGYALYQTVRRRRKAAPT